MNQKQLRYIIGGSIIFGVLFFLVVVGLLGTQASVSAPEIKPLVDISKDVNLRLLTGRKPFFKSPLVLQKTGRANPYLPY